MKDSGEVLTSSCHTVRWLLARRARQWLRRHELGQKASATRNAYDSQPARHSTAADDLLVLGGAVR
jgi:hypothetical protein